MRQEAEMADTLDTPFTPEGLQAALEKVFSKEITQTKIINKVLCIWVLPKDLLKVCQFLKESELDFSLPCCICGVDLGDSLEVVYHFYSISRGHKIKVKVNLSRDKAMVPSLYPIYKGADWLERETAEMLGIIFEDHPDPRHLLLREDFCGYPLRKDFKQQEPTLFFT